MSVIHLGLIGHPLSHSLSPRVHAAALRSCGLEGDYSLFPIPPDDQPGLKDLLARVRSGKIQGLNVTIPHKQNIVQYLDDLTPTGESIGAVNTIFLLNNKLTGDNTDASGFLKDLKHFIVNEKSTIEDRRSSIVLGAGGSARAVVFALAGDGWQVTLAARRPEQARELAASLGHHSVQIADDGLSSIDLSRISLIVNTTPVGMTPNIDQSPWPEELSFPENAAVYDLVYNPRETKLVKDACSQGLPATTGLGMLIEQATLSFAIWTGRQPAREALFEAVQQTTH